MVALNFSLSSVPQPQAAVVLPRLCSTLKMDGQQNAYIIIIW
jgi:hypothetical protein